MQIPQPRGEADYETHVRFRVAHGVNTKLQDKKTNKLLDFSYFVSVAAHIEGPDNSSWPIYRILLDYSTTRVAT